MASMPIGLTRLDEYIAAAEDIVRDIAKTLSIPAELLEPAMPIASYPISNDARTRASLRSVSGEGAEIGTSATRDNRVNLQAVSDGQLSRSTGGVATATLTKAQARRLALNLLIATGDATPGLAAFVQPRRNVDEVVVNRPGGRKAYYSLDDETRTAERAVSALHALVAADNYRGSEAERAEQAKAAEARRAREQKVTDLLLSVPGLARSAAERIIDSGYTKADSPF